jgi:ferredoxin-NADP reductase
LVGGGSGVVPLMSILRYRAAIGSEVPATLLYSSRSWEEIIYRAELDSLGKAPHVRVLHTLTRSHPDDWTGYTRRIDRSMLADAAQSASGGLAYVCGPTVLVENVASELVALGYPPERVKTERFGPSGG